MEELKKPTNKKVLNLHIPEKIMSGVFTNIANVHTSADKRSIVIDFIFSSPTEATLVSRVILTTEHAKALEKVLSDVLKKT